MDCGYSLDMSYQGSSKEYPQSVCSEQKYEKYQNFLSENVSVFGGETFYIFE